MESARPTPEVLGAIAGADLILIAPSNPFVSVGTILAVPGTLEALLAAQAPGRGRQPGRGRRALRGPADRMLASLGGEASATGVVEHYRTAYPGLVDVWVLDVVDEGEAARCASGASWSTSGTRSCATHADRQRLAEQILAAHLPA